MTDPKTLEELTLELARTREQLSELQSSEEMLILDTEGRILEANAEVARRLGYEISELRSLWIWDVSTLQTKDGIERLVGAIDREGRQFVFGHNRKKDGSTYPVEAHLWRGVFGGGEAIYARLRDAQGFHRLIEERDRLISLVENSSEAIAITSPEGKYRYMNPAGLEMIGLDRVGQLKNLSVLDLHPEHEHQALTERILPQVFNGRWEGELDYRNVRTGKLTPCRLNSFAIRHSQTGEVTGLATVAHDISSRRAVERQRERQLRLNEVSRRAAMSLLESDDLNLTINIILEGAAPILDVSRAFLCRFREDRSWVFRTHEWTAREGVGRRIQSQPESALPYAWAMEYLVRGEVIRITDVRTAGIPTGEVSALLRPDVRALLLMPVVVHGQLESFFGFVDTEGPREWEDEEFALLQIIADSFARAVERRMADRERQLIALDLERAVKREKRANRYKSEFLANISHELRTPMNAIVGYAELLGRPNIDQKKQRVWLANIQRSTDHLLSLVNDILDLSKIEAGKMTVDKGPCRLAEVISSVEGILRGWADEKLLELRVEYGDGCPETVLTDPVRLKQILINLVGNAIKFTPGGSVTLRAAGAGQDQFYIAVIDTGVGVPPEQQEELFKPFSQLHRAQQPGGGTGLGLDISRRLARLLGGEIDLESEAGRGSTFTLRLPIGVPLEDGGDVDPPPGTHPNTCAENPIAGGRILIVDDSPENLEVLRFLLSEAGCNCQVAENGAEGVKQALAARDEGRPYDAILMDMNMPVMDGYEATEALRRAGLEEPIIALTALAMSGDMERCREAGCTDYLTKPVMPVAFLVTMGRHMRVHTEPELVRGGAENGADESPGFSLQDNPRFAPLIKRYVASFPEFIAGIREARSEGKSDELRTRVHRLRGTASNYGFPEISTAAGECEDAIAEGAGDGEISGRLGELLRLLEEVAVVRGVG